MTGKLEPGDDGELENQNDTMDEGTLTSLNHMTVQNLMPWVPQTLENLRIKEC